MNPSVDELRFVFFGLCFGAAVVMLICLLTWLYSRMVGRVR